MITLRFDYKINNVRDIHFNYNIDVNIIFKVNERLKGKRGHKNETLRIRTRKKYIYISF